MIYIDSSVGITLTVLAGLISLILLIVIFSKALSTSDSYKDDAKDIGKVGEDDVKICLLKCNKDSVDISLEI